MVQKELYTQLEALGAVITKSHIVYTSGRHGDTYINKDRVYPYTTLISQLCRDIAEQFYEDGIEVVAAPAIGGVILSQWVAFHLTTHHNQEVMAVYADKTPHETFVFKRGYDQLMQGKKVLIVEDVVNTGGSVRKVMDAVVQAGGIVAGMGLLCNRGVLQADLGNPPKLFSLLDLKLASWDSGECPLCLQGIPINTNVGKGKIFNP